MCALRMEVWEVDLNRNAHRIVAALAAEKTGPSKATGRAGGLAGGPARAAALTPTKRKAIAVKANQARWKKRDLPIDVPPDE